MPMRVVSFVVLLFLTAFLAPGKVGAEERLALVIGNENYAYHKVALADNDAEDMAEVLERIGFTVTKGIDLKRQEMFSVVRAFGEQVQAMKDGGVALVYFSGDGYLIDGHNFIVPTDIEYFEHLSANVDPTVEWVVRTLGEARDNLNIIVLDVSRGNPGIKGAIATTNGTSNTIEGVSWPRPSGATVVWYAVAPGREAHYSNNARNSLFTAHLKREIAVTGRSVLAIMQATNEAVEAEAAKRNFTQTPWYEGDASAVARFVLVDFAQQKSIDNDIRIDIPPLVETTIDTTRVTGRVIGTRNGLVLTAGGRRLTVAPDGAFAIELAGLIPGEQAIDVVAGTASGQSAKTTLIIRRKEPEVVIPPLHQGLRKALIVANSRYDGIAWGSLPSVRNDGAAVEAVLREHGFDIIKVMDADRQILDNVIADFVISLKAEKLPVLSLFYFSGHGTSSKSRNYIVPIGGISPFNLEPEKADAQYFAVDDILRRLGGLNRTTLVIIDACREDPNTKGPQVAAVSKSALEPAPRLVKTHVATEGGGIFYATAPYHIARPGPDNGLSPFTEVFVRHLRQGPTTLGRVVRATSLEVKKIFHQVPWYDGDLTILEDIPLRRQ